MRPRQKYFVAGESFATKSNLQERIRKILYGYQDGEYLAHTDFIFIYEILKLHPDYQTKNGVGVKAIYIKQNPIYKNTRGFWVVRFDESETDFSYLEYLKETSSKKKFLNACRVAIELYTQEYKRMFFENLSGKIYYCPYTNESLNFIGSHIDHKAPKTFQQLVKGFIKEHSIDIGQIKINSSTNDNSFQDTFADENLEKLWVNYHNSHAEFQIISKNANLSFPKT